MLSVLAVEIPQIEGSPGRGQTEGPRCMPKSRKRTWKSKRKCFAVLQKALPSCRGFTDSGRSSKRDLGFRVQGFRGVLQPRIWFNRTVTKIPSEDEPQLALWLCGCKCSRKAVLRILCRSLYRVQVRRLPTVGTAAKRYLIYSRYSSIQYSEQKCWELLISIKLARQGCFTLS